MNEAPRRGLPRTARRGANERYAVGRARNLPPMRQGDRIPSDHELRTPGKTATADEARTCAPGVLTVNQAGRAKDFAPMRQEPELPYRKL